MEKTKQEKNITKNLATIISYILNPVSMIIFIVLGVSYRFELSILMFFSVMMPFFIFTAAYIAYKLFIKKDADIDFSGLKMRRHMWVSSFIGFAISFILSHSFYPDLDGMFLRAAFIVFCTGIITIKWKISLHSIGYASFCFTFIKLFGPIWTLSLILLPIVYWARLVLKKHTIWQLIAGTAISVVILL